MSSLTQKPGINRPKNLQGGLETKNKRSDKSAAPKAGPRRPIPYSDKLARVGTPRSSS